MPRGLFWRAFLIMLIPLIMVQATVVYIFYERHWDTVSNQLALDVSGDVLSIMRMAEGVTDPVERALIDEIARREMQFAVVFEDGAVLPVEAPPQSGGISYDKCCAGSLTNASVPPTISTALCPTRA